MENGFVLQQEAQTIQDLLNYIEQQLPGALQALSNAIGDETTRATNKENELLAAIGGLIPKTEKGRPNGVASLDGSGMVPVGQLQFPNRGALNPADIDSTSLVAGLYQVNGKVIGPAILNGEEANGIFLQYPWGSRVQVLLVGRAFDAPAGEQVEIYVRRYLPTPQRWTVWMTTENFAKKDDVAFLEGKIDTLLSDVLRVERLIPSTASPQNQLADKDFVNHSVATNTANFIGTFASVAELEAYSGTLTNNDYAFVIVTDAQGNEFYDRYKYNANATPPAWLFEYRIESTAFTAAQWAAIQSGITASLVTKLSDLPTNTALQEALTLINTTLSGKQDTISDLAEIRSGASAGATAYQKPQGGIPASDIAPDVIPDVSNKENKTTIVAAYNTQDPSQPVRGVPCNLSTYYRIPVPIESLTLLLPPNPQSGYVENIVVYLTGGTTPAVTIQSSDVNPAPIYYHDGYAIESGKTYEINILWNGAAWVVASVEIVINN